VSPAATGRVYIFNTTNQEIVPLLNSCPLEVERGVIGRAGGPHEQYAAAHVSVPRSNASQIYEPVFAQSNTFQVLFQGLTNTYQIALDLKTSPSNNDLLLYIFYGYVVLFDSANNVVLLNQPASEDAPPQPSAATPPTSI
jgi:hypothetical protein